MTEDNKIEALTKEIEKLKKEVKMRDEWATSYDGCLEHLLDALHQRVYSIERFRCDEVKTYNCIIKMENLNE